MAQVNISSEHQLVQNELGRIMTQIPDVQEDLTEEMMEEAVEEIRRSAEKRFDNGDYTGNMMSQLNRNNIQSINRGDEKVARLDLKGPIPGGGDYIEWHENASEGHFVEVSRDNSPIMDWAEKHYDGDTIPDYLFVRPTPFIQPALQRIMRRMRSKVRSGDNELAEFIRSEQ